MPLEVQENFLKAILNAERELANGIIDSWAGANTYERAVMEILEPVLERIGRMWMEDDSFSLAQGYIAGKIAEDLMRKAAEERKGPVGSFGTRGPVVIGNIEDDYHALGRKMVVTFLRSAGWIVYDLGNDVMAEDFINKACEVGAPVIGVSAMMYSTAKNIKKVREEIDRRGLTGRIKLAVGGAIFILRPELVEEVGGDGTAKNAIIVPDLMEGLIWKG